jgi:transcriptional regulator with XRE-family HTH domain
MARTFDILKTQKLLDERRIGYPELGAALGMTRQAVGHWFRERGEPTVQQMKVMARVLGVHWLELCTEETVVLYEQEERDHMQQWRGVSPETRALVEQILAADRARKS